MIRCGSYVIHSKNPMAMALLRATSYQYSALVTAVLLSIWFFHHIVAAALSYNSYHDSTSSPVRVISWNILAPVYAQKYAQRYSSDKKNNKSSSTSISSLSYLDWHTYRQERVRQCLTETLGNIICLQEMQVDLWDDFTRSLMTIRKGKVREGHADSHGDNIDNDDDDNNNDTTNSYTCLVQNTTHEVACAVLLRPADQFEVVATESRSRALIVVAHMKVATVNTTTMTTTTIPLIIASVHLEAGPSHEQTRFFQMRSLLKRIHWHRCHYLSSSTATTTNDDDDNNNHAGPMVTTAPPLVILAGDCNMVHNGPVFQWLSTGRWDSRQQLALCRTAPPHYAFLPATVLQHPAIGRTYGRNLILDYIWLLSSSSSSSPKSSANETVVSLVDAVPALAFASRRMNNNRISSSVRVDDTVGTGHAYNRTDTWWPNAFHPSDHWPIAMELVIRHQQQQLPQQ